MHTKLPVRCAVGLYDPHRRAGPLGWGGSNRNETPELRILFLYFASLPLTGSSLTRCTIVEFHSLSGVTIVPRVHYRIVLAIVFAAGLSGFSPSPAANRAFATRPQPMRWRVKIVSRTGKPND